IQACVLLAFLGVRSLVTRARATDPVPVEAPEPAPVQVVQSAPEPVRRIEPPAEIPPIDPRIDNELAIGTAHINELSAAIDSIAGEVTATCGELDVVRSGAFQILGQIGELVDVSDRISNMVDVIRRISSQTNLLAL